MKTNLKRLVSLLLVVVMLASSFSGFGTLTAHAQHFTLIRPDEYPYLHIENDMTLQLDLTGRSGTIGAISWQLTDLDGTPIVGTAENPVFTVGTSPEAAALGASDDLITLHGDIIAAELGVTPTIPKEGINIRLHYEEAGNMSGVDDIWLMGDWWEPNNGFPKPQRTDYLVGYSHRSGADCLSGVFNVNRRDAAHPQGDDLEAYITALCTIENLDAEGNHTEADVITFERISDYEWCFSAQMPGSTVFRATYEDAEGTTGFYDFTLNAVTTLYELQPHFPNGTLCVLKNGTLTVDTIVLRRTTVPQDGGGYMISSEPVESYTLNAVSDDTTLILPTVSGNIVELAASDLPGSARVTFTASGTYGGEAFSVTSEEYWIDLMDHYGQLQFEGFDPNIEVGETIDMSGFFRYFEYTYSPNGNSIVDRTADTIWTIWDDNNVFTMDSAALPVLERVSPDSTMLFVSASLDCGDYGTMNDEVCFGVDPRNNGGSGSEGNLLMYWEDPDTYNIFDTETSHYPLYTEISNMGDAQIDIVVDCGQWDEEGNFISWGSDMITGEDGIYAVNGAALLEAAAEHCGVANDYNFSLRACLYVDGELCNEETTWGNLWRSYIRYEFPGDETQIKTNGSSTHRLEPIYGYYLTDADHRDGYYGTVQLNDIQVSNVNGTADVTVTAVEDGWELYVGSFFEGSFDTTLYYTDVMTGEEASYTYTTTRVNELWEVHLSTERDQLLPGETRTVTASIERLVYDPERGSIYGDTTGATLHWEPEQFPGVTYTPNGNTLTVATTPETGVYNTLEIGARLEVDAPVLPCEPIHLRTRDRYYVMDSRNMADPAFGESCTYTPVVEYVWLDEEAADPIQRRNLTAADSSYYLTISYWGDLSVSVGGTTVPGTHEEATYPLGTTFTYTRTGIDECAFEIALYNYVDPEYSENVLSIGNHFASIDLAAAFNQEVYTLNVGDTLDLLGELTFEPAGIGEHLVEAYWRHDANGVISIDENGVASALVPGETWVGYIYPYSGILAECTIRVTDPSNNDVYWGEPDYAHIFENQILYYPLDTSTIAGKTNVTLELDCGYWENDTFISFGDGMLTKQYDTETGTVVTGVHISGEKLHEAATSLIPYEFINHELELVARVYVDGALYDEFYAPFELRTTYVDFHFEEDSTILADLVPMQFAFGMDYELWVQFGHDNYQYGEPYADGVFETDTFWNMKATVLEGDKNAVTMEPNDDESAYLLTVAPGFLGKVKISQYYADRLGPAPSLEHSFVLTFTDEVWGTWVEVSENQLLPGEQRTVTAHVEHLVYNPEEGQIPASTSGASVVWEYDSNLAGVTYTPNGNALTIKTTGATEFGLIPLTASVKVGGTVVATEHIDLSVIESYFAFDLSSQIKNVALGASATIKPVLTYHWLDAAGKPQSKAMTAADSDYVLEMFLYQDSLPNLTVNGTAVNQGDTFPLGTTFTYKQLTPAPTEFFIDAVLKDEDSSIFLNSSYYYIECADEIELNFAKNGFTMTAGDTLDLKAQLVYSPSNLLNHVGSLTWKSENTAVATVDAATGKVTAKTAGVAEIVLSSDLYDEILRTVVIVATVDAGIKDPIPEQDVTKPVENVTVVHDPETEATVENETIGLLGKLVEDEGVDSCFDGDVDKLITAVETGASLKTELIPTPMDDAAVSDLPVADQKALNDKIAAVLGAGADAAYFDITLQVTANGEQLGTMTQTDEKIKIRLTIPTDLRNPDYEFTVFRLHNGVVEALETINNGDWTVTIFSDRFSTYALGYTTAGVTRIYGQTRYQTSFKIADEVKANLGVDKFASIIVASGNNYADALAGSYLACVKGAPILMASGSNDAELKAYIDANLVSGGQVYILGGKGAVPESLDAVLSGYNVKRLAGNTRFDTNIAILQEAGVTAGDEILVCTGFSFADSLAASAVGKPILLVDTINKKLTEGQKNYLATVDTDKFCIIGGTGAVDATVEALIQQYGSVERVFGANRYQTSVAVAERFFDAPSKAVIAYALNYPDGLCGGPLAASMGAPLLLTLTNLQSAITEYTTANGIHSGAVLGGTALIDDPTAKDIFDVETIEVN